MTTSAKEILDKVVSSLKDMDATLSGEETPFANVWEEIKDQVQNEESIFWDAYVATMEPLIECAISDAKEVGEVETPPYFDDESDETLEEAYMEMLLERAGEEPVECAPFDFKYFCYPIADFTAYGKVLKRTGYDTFEAEVFSVAAPRGEFGTVHVSRIDSFLSKAEFAAARKKGWPEQRDA